MHTVCFKYVAEKLKRFHKAKINTEFSAQLSLQVLVQDMPLVAYTLKASPHVPVIVPVTAKTPAGATFMTSL